jgi:hypothetical protein
LFVFEQAREVAEEAHRSFARLIAQKAHITDFFIHFGRLWVAQQMPGFQG